VEPYVHKKAAPPPRNVPLSREVARHVVNDHARQCLGCEPNVFICPCDRARLVCCISCHAVLLVAIRPGRECEHAAAFLWPEP
jgi:hypothetical protein